MNEINKDKIKELVSTNSIKIIGGNEVFRILEGAENEIISLIESTYKGFYSGINYSANSSFLRFSSKPQDRIISLPAYLGDNVDVAGMKWISSFPSNLHASIERASAIQILNDGTTGRSFAVIEASIISSKRTAASAALASRYLFNSNKRDIVIGIIGCGYIGFELIKFLLKTLKHNVKILLFDINKNYLERFSKICKRLFNVEVNYANDIDEISCLSDITVFATTSLTPYVHDKIIFKKGSLILHISLRDLSPVHIKNCINVCDVKSHAFSENTSLGLAKDMYTLSDLTVYELSTVLNGNVNIKRSDDDVIIFSPFGLGVLDLALASYVFNKSCCGRLTNDFFPESWFVRMDSL